MAGRVMSRPDQRNARIGAAGLAARLALMFFARPRLFFQSTAALLYTEELRRRHGRQAPVGRHLGGRWRFQEVVRVTK